VYLRVDLDALDPSIAPGIVDAPVPHGLSIAQVDDALDALTGTLGVRAVALTTYTPSRDVDGATHATALHVLDRIAAGDEDLLVSGPLDARPGSTGAGRC
jgi:arginase family enzyme